jgi:hypothetical protein
MQQWIISFVTTGDPNSLFGGNAASTGQNTTISSWEPYGSTQNVVAFSDDGFIITTDELATDQVVWWNKVSSV